MKNEEINRLLSKKYISWTDLTKSNMCETFINISHHINSTNPRQILFHALNNALATPTCPCGKVLSWHPDLRQYRKYCSKKCTGLFSVLAAKETNIKKYGVTSYTKTPEWALKVKTTSILKFGEEHYSKTADFNARVVNSNLAKFGVAYPAQSDVVKRQVAESFMTKYGVDNPAKMQSSKDKAVTSNQMLYGVNNPAQRHYSDEVNSLLADNEAFTELCKHKSVTEISRDLNISSNPLRHKAKRLGISLPNFNQSLLEKDISTYISSLYKHNILFNDRSILGDQELDIVLPGINVAFECNGSYWHSELQGRCQMYHLNKHKICASKELRLIHIWEHDWYQKQDIIKSKIKSILQLNQKIYARNCVLNEVTTDDTRIFLNANHLQGYNTAGTVNYGLYYQLELIAIMTFSRNRFGNDRGWELLRFANKLHYNIVGGASKLFSRFVKDHRPAHITSYCDISMNTGLVYLKLGFAKTHSSSPNYRYTKDYKQFYSRNKFQKKKLPLLLESYNPDLTEWGNMQLNNYDRIWDCGNLVFKWTGLT